MQFSFYEHKANLAWNQSEQSWCLVCESDGLIQPGLFVYSVQIA